VPRPRTIDDADVLTAAATLIGRIGPASVTLQRVADEVGLSAATLVQRFGSKRDLLLAVARSGPGSAEPFSRARSSHASVLDALVAALVSTVESIDTPATLANHLAFLQMDLQDPDFHASALADARERRAAIADALDDAVAAGELRAGIDTRRLARTVLALYNGALITWGMWREGPLGAWLGAELDVLLPTGGRRSAAGTGTG
jgi:AcrR family transcriptional regulator